MVTVDDKKYACETCIKGHRSSACKHTDRPLFEIKKKGRPVTQCEHCRELRKTKQVHVKCSCGKDATGSSSGAVHEGTSKVPPVAAFPNGLPKGLEAKVGSPVVHSDGSESDLSGDQSTVSTCKCGPNQCHCCVPRKSASKRRMSGATKADHPQAADDLLAPTSPLSTHVWARIAELRPVLPRPPRPTSGPLHTPSSGTPHGHGGRHHSHDYSPYGRAYEQTFPAEMPSNLVSSAQLLLPSNIDPQLFTNTDGQLPSQVTFPSACTCGDGCQCPGCTQHRKSPAPSGTAFSTCCNPETCSFCLDCTILSMPPGPSLGPSETSEIDAWLQQLPLSSPSSFSPVPSQIPSPPAQVTPPSGLPNIPVAHCRTASGPCTCLPGACFCPITCCQDYCPNRALPAARPQATSSTSSDRSHAASSSARRPSIHVPDFMTMTQMYASNTGSYYSPNAPSRPSSRSSASSFTSGSALPGSGRQSSKFSPTSMAGSAPVSLEGPRSAGLDAQQLSQQQPQPQQQNQPPYSGYFPNDMSRRY